MHPLLKSFKQILLFVATWIPAIIGVAFVHTIVAQASYKEAFILLTPVMIVEIFIFLSIWFVCKSTPLETRNIGFFLLRHLITLVVMSTIWVHLAMIYSELLNVIYETTNWRTQFDTIMPVLMVIGVFVYFLSSLLSYLLLALEQARTSERQALNNQLKASKAELRFLKATIHPHFLFNSLTALSTLTKTSSEKAQQVCLQLAEFLRYSLTFSKKEFVTVSEEMDHIKNYLGVEKIRLGKRLNTSFEIEEALSNETILSFSLQPLIENAIKHSIEQRLDGGTISLILKKADDHIFVNVSNPIAEESKEQKPGGHGLPNLKARLAKVYNNEAKILAHKGAAAFSVKLYLPLINNSATSPHES
jgi:sensor histidine kinase YesM